LVLNVKIYSVNDKSPLDKNKINKIRMFGVRVSAVYVVEKNVKVSSSYVFIN